MNAELSEETNGPQKSSGKTNKGIEHIYYFACGSNLNPQRMKDRAVIFTKSE